MMGAVLIVFALQWDYYPQVYFKVFDLVLRELQDWFNQRNVLEPVLALKPVLIQAAKSNNYEGTLQTVETSCYADDFEFTHLKRWLPILIDVVKEINPAMYNTDAVGGTYMPISYLDYAWLCP